MKGPAIKKLRLGLGWTQQEMADYLMVSGRSRVSVMERKGYTANGVVGKLLNRLLANREGSIVGKDDLLRTPESMTQQDVLTARLRLGKNQEEFGRILGVTRNYVSQLETGRRKVNKRLARLISLEKSW